MSVTTALLILVVIYGAAIWFMYQKRAMTILKFGVISSAIFLTGAAIIALFPTRLAVQFNGQLPGLALGLLQFFLLFALLYYVRFIQFRYYGYSLQDTLRKILILLLIPAIILIYYQNDLRFLFTCSGSWIVFLLIAGSMLGIAVIRNKVYKLNIFHKLLGQKRYLKAFGITYLIQLVHVAIPEEFFFRVFMVGMLRNFGDVSAVVISALFFGLGHIWFLDRKMGMGVRFGQAVTFHTTVGILFAVLWLKFPCYIALVLLHALLNSLVLVYLMAKKLYFSM